MKNNMVKKELLHPRYWLTWLGLGVLWLLIQLPWSWQMYIGKHFGDLMYRLLPRRRQVSCINLELAFPALSEQEREQLNRLHFQSLGQSLFDMPLSWWGRESSLHRLSAMDGWEHLQTAKAQAKQEGAGIILLSAHFTSLELGGRLLAMHLPLHVVYRPHQNPVIDHVVARVREQRYGKAISRDDIRDMVRSLRDGEMVWYAQDQNFGHKHSVFSPFFDVPAATNTSIVRLSSLGRAIVVPFFTLRDNNGYRLVFLPALDAFPSGDLDTDVARVNQLIEAQVKETPEQYLWTHRRFKDMPNGGNRYDDYRRSSGSCVKK